MFKRMIRSLGWCSLATVAVTSQAEVVIEDFKADAVSLNWQIVNDSVMGGISTSRMIRISDEVVRFSGELSLDNNGGFASVRATGSMADLSGTDTISIRVKGDGRRYQFRLRSSTGLRVPDFSAEFQTKVGEWQTHYLRISDFVPGWRGRKLRGVPPIKPDEIRSIGILLGDKNPGGFALDIDWVKAVKADDS